MFFLYFVFFVLWMFAFLFCCFVVVVVVVVCFFKVSVFIFMRGMNCFILRNKKGTKKILIDFGASTNPHLLR